MYSDPFPLYIVHASDSFTWFYVNSLASTFLDPRSFVFKPQIQWFLSLHPCLWISKLLIYTRWLQLCELIRSTWLFGLFVFPCCSCLWLVRVFQGLQLTLLKCFCCAVFMTLSLCFEIRPAPCALWNNSLQTRGIDLENPPRMGREERSWSCC